MPGDLFVLARLETATNLLYTKLSLSGVHLRYAMGAGGTTLSRLFASFLCHSGAAAWRFSGSQVTR